MTVLQSIAFGLIFLLASGSGDLAGTPSSPEGANVLYTFDEGQGPVVDHSPMHNDGSLYGAKFVPSGEGVALSFDGRASFAKCGDKKKLLLGRRDFTVRLWLKLNGLQDGVIIGKKGGEPNATGWLLQIGPSGRDLEAIFSNGSASASLSVPLADTNWHEVIVTRQGKTCLIYLDGKLAGTKTDDVFAADIGNDGVYLHLGKILGNSHSFLGLLDNVLIQESGMGAADVAANYQKVAAELAARKPVVNPKDTLLVHYRFDHDPGDLAKDLSGHGNDGKIQDGRYLNEVEGRKGVLRLNGTSSWIDLGKPESLRFGGDMSFEMWVRLNGPVKSQWALIYGEDPPINFTFTYAYWHSITLWYRSSDAWLEDMILPVDRKVLSDHWSHLAVVLEYPRCRYYLNGKLLRDELMPVPGLAQYQNVAKHIGGAGYGGGRYCPLDLTEFRLYSRALTADEVAAHAEDRELEPAPTETIAVEPDWYKDRLTVRLTSQGRKAEGARAELQLLDDGKPVASPQTIDLKDGSANGSERDEATGVFPLLPFKNRHLTVVGLVLDSNGKVLCRTTQDVFLKKPDWIQSQDGYSDKVLAPWTALKAEVKDGLVAVNVWNRQQVFGAAPFPREIQSGPVQLLAAPIALTCSADGQAVSWEDEPAQLLAASEIQATLKQLRHGESLDLEVKTRIDYDGFTIFDCDLTAKRDVRLDTLFLDIPLSAPYASLCYGNKVLPLNPDIPMSEWFSGAVKGDLSFRFSADIWLGDQERGLCWQAESDQDWHYADPQKAIEILPQGKTTLFHAHLVDQTTTLKKGEKLHYKFALLATPIKPLTRDAWSLRIARGEPYGEDLGLIDAKSSDGRSALQVLYDEGIRHLFFNVNDVWCWPMPVHEQFAAALHRLIDEAHGVGLKLYPYLIHQRFPVGVPEFDIYGLNMAKRPLKQYLQYGQPPGNPRQGPITVKFGADSQGSIFMCPNSPALQDAFIHSLAERMKEYGDDGVYLDGTVHIVPCENMDHGCGYRAADGTVHDTYPVFAIRDFMKRIYTVIKSRHPDGVVDVHCSWGYNPSALAYADVLWNGEQWHHLAGKGTSYVPGELTLDKFQTEFTGYQLGVAAESLCYRLGSTMKVASVSLLHDISPRLSTNGFEPLSKSSDPYYRLVPQLWRMRDQFGADQAEKLFYWRNQNYVNVTPQGCYATLLKHPQNGVLVFVSNLSRDPQDVQVTFQLEALGLKGKSLDVFDALTGKKVAISDQGAVALSLKSQEWLYLWLKPTTP